MRILLTNTRLEGRSGTETYVRDLALGLQRRGHAPMIYTPRPGALAEALRAQGIPVVTDPFELEEAPDLIHGHHALETLTALNAFPGCPGLFLLHDAVAATDAPPRHPRLLHTYAVDEACADRLRDAGLPVAGLLPNAVDLDRFRPRGPLPERPRRALVFSNYARTGNHLEAIQASCRQAGLPLDVVGEGVGRFAAEPETLLGDYDLVFGKARCALEAMATGCAVILCDFAGFGGLVTRDRVAALRPLNFGRRALAEPIDAARILQAIQAYDAQDAAAVSAWIREEAALPRLLDRVETAHASLRQAWQAHPGVPLREEARAQAEHLKHVAQLEAEARAAAQATARDHQLRQLGKALGLGALLVLALVLALAMAGRPGLALAGMLGGAFLGTRLIRRLRRMRA